jgi:hypothetical protein
LREAVVSTFKSYHTATADAANVSQQNFCCDVATDKLDAAAEHAKTQCGEDGDIVKVSMKLNQTIRL